MLGTRHQRYRSFDIHLPRKASFASLRRMASYTHIVAGEIKHLEPTEHCVSPPPVDPDAASPLFNSPDDIKGCAIDPLMSPPTGSKEEKPMYSTSPSLCASRRPQPSIETVALETNIRQSAIRQSIKRASNTSTARTTGYRRRDSRDPRKKVMSPVDDGGFPEVVISSLNQSTVSLELFRSNSLVIPPLSRFSLDTESDDDDDESVTPLNLLSDEPDWVDCPFCQRRVETRVKKEPSKVTHIATTGLFIATFGMSSSAKKDKKYNITHFCTKCDRMVAHQHHGKRMEALGTTKYLREVSRYVRRPSIAQSTRTRTSTSHENRRPYNFF
ncbi:unnamed protein product [Clonostachys rosea f. rosea IK726]|uniref:LITAF domain-containing protein n=2 Tax=Bionectria ochroleuca TaxID=29856 RepID=A0A8H7NMD7_BIOOC|nr:unnamed protein product [Clonostachys rosea f. rosea IK726]